MSISRRGIVGAGFAGAFSAKNIAKSVGQRLSQTEVRGLDAANPSASQYISDRIQLMPPDKAVELIWSKKEYLDELISEAFKKVREEVRVDIDPDLDVLKSVSPMMKVVYQRQRVVAQEVATRGGRNNENVFQKLMQKLIWGET